MKIVSTGHPDKGWSQVVRKTYPGIKAFFDSLIEQTGDAGINQADLLALPKKDRNPYKHTGFFCPGIYDKNVRRMENVTSFHLLTFDLDDADQSNAALAALEFGALDDFNWFYYHTISSTADDPRIRVIIDADIESQAYHVAVSTVGRLMGLKWLNPESRDSARLMFVPNHCHDGLQEQEMHTGGRTFGMGDIDTLPVLAGPAKKSSASSIPAGGDVDDFMENIELVGDVDEHLIREALEFLDPGADRNTWMDVACCLKHQYQDDDSRGYDIFHDWSSGEIGDWPDIGNYEGNEDCQKFWDENIDANPAKKPRTIGSLFHDAKDAGWKAGYDYLMKMVEECAPEMEAIAAVGKNISRSPLDAFQFKVLTDMLNAKLKETTGSSDKVFIKGICRHKYEAGDITVPEWCKDLYYIGELGKFYSVKGSGTFFPTERAFNLIFDHHLIRPGAEKIPASEFLCDILQRKVMRLDYMPGGKRLMGSEEDRSLNTWKRPEASPNKVGYDQVKLVMDKVFKRVVLRGDGAILKRQLAFIVQKPGIKLNQGCLIYGDHGTGKTFISEIMAVVIGKSNHVEVPFDNVIGAFNPMIASKQFVAVEEVAGGGFTNMNKMKTLITSPTVLINIKNVSEYHVRNFTFFYMTSNFDGAIKLEKGDRRWTVLESRMWDDEDVVNDFFAGVSKLLKKYPGAFTQYFMDVDLKGLRGSSRPEMTTAKDKLIEESVTPLEDAISQCIDDPDLDDVYVEYIAVPTLLRALPKMMKNVPNSRIVGKALSKAGYGSRLSTRTMGYVRFREGHSSLLCHGPTETGKKLITQIKLFYSDPEEWEIQRSLILAGDFKWM